MASHHSCPRGSDGPVPTPSPLAALRVHSWASWHFLELHTNSLWNQKPHLLSVRHYARGSLTFTRGVCANYWLFVRRVHPCGTHHSVCTHLPVDGHLGSFQLGAVHARSRAALRGQMCSFLSPQNGRTLRRGYNSRFKTRPRCSAKRLCALLLRPAALSFQLLPSSQTPGQASCAADPTGVWPWLVVASVPPFSAQQC